MPHYNDDSGLRGQYASKAEPAQSFNIVSNSFLPLTNHTPVQSVIGQEWEGVRLGRELLYQVQNDEHYRGVGI